MALLTSPPSKSLCGSEITVLALPRGGVQVAYEIGKELGLPVDIFVVRKLGVPGHEELAMGAIASGGVRHINRDVVDQLRIDSETIDVASRREQLYRGIGASVRQLMSETRP